MGRGNGVAVGLADTAGRSVTVGGSAWVGVALGLGVAGEGVALGIGVVVLEAVLATLTTTDDLAVRGDGVAVRLFWK
ncbi:MAG: hypothetical protein M5U01_32875 [Ardenticatenaceae bacterium]|nr:hypothetical protein [Ardenticatenaceae bacterium]